MSPHYLTPLQYRLRLGIQSLNFMKCPSNLTSQADKTVVFILKLYESEKAALIQTDRPDDIENTRLASPRTF